MTKIVRLTLFKLPDPDVVKDAAKQYSTLAQDAKKDGKPYIVVAAANTTHEDPRSQGYTLVSRVVFESKEDMDYYDNKCETHAAMKETFKSKAAGPPLVVVMDSE